MKKKLALMCIAGAVVMGLCACGSKTGDAAKTETTEESSETSTQEAATEAPEEKVSERPDYVAIQDLNMDEYVTLPDYNEMTVNVAKIEVVDEDIETYINSSVLTTYPVTDRAVKEGDIATIDYVGKKDDVAFEGGTAEGYQLNIGSGTFIEGFEEGLVGVMPGETVDLNLKFPDNYKNTELAGADVVFTVTVKEIRESADYETVTMEQLALMGLDFESKEELWDKAGVDLEADAKAAYQSNVGNAIVEELMKTSEFKEVPGYLIEEEVQNYNTYMEALCQSTYGCDLETFVTQYYQLTMEDYNTQLTAMAEDIVKQYFIMEAIARKEGITVTDEEIMEKAAAEAEEYGYESADSLLEEVGRTTYRMYMIQQNVMEKLIDTVKVDNTVQETEAAPETETASETETEAKTE